MKAFIESIHVALPEGILDNQRLAEEFPGWSAEKIYEKTGIRERRISSEGECASDLSVRVVNELFERGGCDPSSVDFIINCTVTPDFVIPATACVLQNRLGVPRTCGAIDVNLGCSGYIYSLGLAKALIETGQARNLLLINADTITKFIHPRDKSVRTLFGDAATVTWIRAREKETLVGPFVYGTDGAGAENLIIPAGGARRARMEQAEVLCDESGSVRTVNHLFQNGPEVFNFALSVVPDLVAGLLQKAGVESDDVDLFVFHQANRFLLEHLRKKLRIPSEKFVIELENVGNTVSCSIPIALKNAVTTGRLVSGSLVMLVGFGVGYSWGATLVRWGH